MDILKDIYSNAKENAREQLRNKGATNRQFFLSEGEIAWFMLDSDFSWADTAAA